MAAPSQYQTQADADTAANRLKQEARQFQQPRFLPLVKDISASFYAASANLPPGNLVKDESFTLFEAVSALEIMDPKMDTGYVPLGDSFESEFDVCAILEPSEILWIMNELMRLEMLFQDGYPLSQNIFTSLHLFRLISPTNQNPPQFYTDAQRPLKIDLLHDVLRAYCIAVVKTCDLTIQIIQSSTYFEEEDFVTHLFGRELLPKISLEDALIIVREAVTRLESSTIDHKLKQALVHQLLFRGSILEALQNSDRCLDTCWTRILGYLTTIETNNDLAQPIHSAFSYKIQRQLASSTPPRPVPDVTWKDACTKWCQLCKDVLSAIQLTRYEVCRSHHSLLRAILAFMEREPTPTTFARAIMQDILFSNENIADSLSHFDLVLMSLRDLVLAGDPLIDPTAFEVELPTDPRYKCARLVEDFLQKATMQYTDFCRCILQNRCRFRRAILQSIPLWDQLQSEGRNSDVHINEIGKRPPQYPLELWSRYHQLTAVEWAQRLGVELDVLQLHEFGPIYGQMTKISLGKINALRMAASMMEQRKIHLQRAGDVGGLSSVANSLRYLQSLLWMETVIQCLSNSLSDLYEAFEAVGLIRTHQRPYADRRLQFEARNKPFLGLENPPLPEFEHGDVPTERNAISVSQCSQTIENRLQLAKAPLQELKKSTAVQVQCVGTEERWKKELLNLERTLIGLRVAASQFLRICKANDMANAMPGDDISRFATVSVPPPGKRYVQWLAVPQINEKK